MSLRVACMSDPCSVIKCGHQATCFQEPHVESISDILQKFNLQLNNGSSDAAASTTTSTSTTTTQPEATCRCKPGFVGNPYERCFPSNVTNGCGCERLVFTSKDDAAVAKHENSYGEFFLFDVREDGQPVYQVQSKSCVVRRKMTS